MIAQVSSDKMIITLPVPLGTAVFIISSNQHDGLFPELREYGFGLLGTEIYLNRSQVDKAISDKEKSYGFR